MSRQFFRPILGVMFLVSIVAISCDSGPTPVRLKYQSVGNQLSLDIEVTGLKPSKPYMLSLNGKSGQAGNDLLCQIGEKYGSECYYDFRSEDTDGKRTLSYKGSVSLPKGKYDVTFVIKDVDDNYKPVLIRDHWRFEITK